MSSANPLAAWLPPAPPQGIPWLDAAREAARAHAVRVPERSDEDWRYTSTQALLAAPFTPVVAGPAAEIELAAAACLPAGATHRFVFINGCLAPALSAPGRLPPGARIASLRSLLASDAAALAEHLTRIAGVGRHAFTALNTLGFADGLAVLLDPGTVLEQPIELVHLAVAQPDGAPLIQPRHIVVLGAGARASVIESYAADDPAARYCTNVVLEIALGAGASLDHHRLQDEGLHGFHLTGLYLEQQADSRYLGLNLGWGARWARTDLDVRCSGPGAACDLRGLYLAGSGQTLAYHLDVGHHVPRCTSRERFKGIVYGHGHAVFDGRVYVAPDAQQTDAAMTNHNLLLSPEAEIDAKPRLEINADDVRCSHGTAIGQLEPEMLFYLRSRGIAEPMARRMLCLGFAEEIIDALAPAALRTRVIEQVGQRLAQV